MNRKFLIFNINYEKIYLYLFVSFAFIIPLSRSLISIYIVLLTLVWILEGDFKRKFNQIKENQVIIALTFFILFMYLSITWSDGTIIEGLKTATKPLRLILIPMIVLITSLKYNDIPKVITAFLFGMLVSEILSYGIFFELWILPVGHGVPMDPTPFMHHLDYATFLTFTSLLLLNRFFDTQDWKIKAFYFVYFLFVTSNLFLNGGRTGHFAFAISIFMVGFLNIKNKIKAFFAMLILVFAIFYSAYQISPVFKVRFDQGSNEISKLQSDDSSKYHGSFGQRLGFWIVGSQIIEDHFFFGTGTGAEGIKFKEYLNKQTQADLKGFTTIIGEYHNQFVQIFTRLGLVGFMLYLLMWYCIANLKIENFSMSSLRYIFITVFCTASLVENIFENQFPMIMFAIFVSIFIVSSKNNNYNFK